jgi:hypothetical protein
MTTIDQLNDAAKVLRAYVDGNCAVSVRVESRLDKLGNSALEYVAQWGDVMGRGAWKYGCAFGATIEICLGKALTEIEAIKADHGREQRELEQQAAALGFILVKQAAP